MELIKFWKEWFQVKVDKWINWKEDIWLDVNTMASIFEIDYTVVWRHIKNIYKNKEVWPHTYKEYDVITEKNGKKYKTKKREYNLDVILSVWYRVNGKKWTEFRVWANNILNKYLINGYVINERAMLDKWMHEVVSLLNNCQQTLKDTKNWRTDELEEVLDIIKKYWETFTSLQNYDSNNFKLEWTEKKVKYIMDYNDAIKYIDILKKHLIEKWEATVMFWHEKQKGVLSWILWNIFASFFGSDAYEYLEEKASQLLYLIVKDHPFTDWNKRLASYLFVMFLKKNDFLYKKDWTMKISEEALAFLTVMIAQSKKEERDSMVKMLINTIRWWR